MKVVCCHCGRMLTCYQCREFIRQRPSSQTFDQSYWCQLLVKFLNRYCKLDSGNYWQSSWCLSVWCSQRQSTAHVLVDMLQHWNKALDDGHSVCILFIDHAIAFDNVDQYHSIVIQKLEAFGVPDYCTVGVVVPECTSAKSQIILNFLNLEYTEWRHAQGS